MQWPRTPPHAHIYIVYTSSYMHTHITCGMHMHMQHMLSHTYLLQYTVDRAHRLAFKRMMEVAAANRRTKQVETWSG